MVGKTFPAFPAHAQHAILRIWQEVHVLSFPVVKVRNMGEKGDNFVQSLVSVANTQDRGILQKGIDTVEPVWRVMLKH